MPATAQAAAACFSRFPIVLHLRAIAEPARISIRRPTTPSVVRTTRRVELADGGGGVSIYQVFSLIACVRSGWERAEKSRCSGRQRQRRCLPELRHQARSNRSRFITLVHAAAK